MFWSVCSIFIFALFVRLAYLYDSSDSPTFTAPIVDARGYDFLARQFVEKGVMNERFFWQQFLYPFLLSIVYFFSNSSIIVAKILQVLLGAFTCVLTFQLGRKVFNLWIGLIAGILISLYGPLIFHETDLIVAGLVAFCSVAMVLLFLKIAAKQNLLICVAVGMCGALGTLARPNFLPFFFMSYIWLTIVFYRRGKFDVFATKALAIILAAFALALLPVGIQNCRITGRFSVLPASGGINLYIGNNPDFDAAEIRPGPKWEAISNLPKSHGISDSLWEGQRFFYEKTYSYIIHQPVDFLKGLFRKTICLISSREMPGNVDVYSFRTFSPILSMLMWKIGRYGFPFGLLLPFAIIGLVYRWRRIPMPMILFLLIYPLPLILGHVESRYRVAIVPILAVLAAGGMEFFISLIKTRRWTQLTVPILVVSVLVFISTFPGPFQAEKLDYQPELYKNVGITLDNQGKTEEAIKHYKQAIRFSPKYSEAHYNLGVAYYKQGQSNMAMDSYRQAIDSDPNNHKAHYNLGVIISSLGNFELAKTHYSQALRINPNYISAHRGMAIEMLRQDRLDQATDWLHKALKLEPNDAKTNFLLGVVLVRYEKLDLAIETFEKVLQIDPSHARAKDILADLLKDKK